MNAEENKKTARRLVIEVFNAGRSELIDSLVSEKFSDHALPPDLEGTREAFKSMIPVLRRAFPDLEYTIEDMIAEGDVVAQRLTARGTQQGEFMGMQPTGRTASWQEMHWHRFDPEGRLVEHWDTTDALGMMMQLRDPGPPNS